MSICRTCLSRKELKPIFPDTNHCSAWSQQLYLATGVKIAPNDGLTQLICLRCINLIQSTILLRKLSSESEEVLKKAKSIKNLCSQNNITNKQTEISSDKKGTGHLKNEIKKLNLNLEHIKNNCTKQLVPNNRAASRRLKKENKNRNKKYCKKKSDEKFNKSNINYEYSVTIEEFESSNDEDFMKEDIIADLECDSGIYKRIRIEDYESSDSLELDDGVCETEDDAAIELNVKAREKELIERARRKLISKEQERKLMSLAVTPYNRLGPIKCSVCDKVLRSVQNFKCHAKTHFELENTCEECGKKFVNRSHMRYHQQRVHGRTKRLACPQCPYRAVDLQALQNHQRAEHTGERPYICDVCGVSFRMRANIVQHMRKHFGVRNLQCDRCPAMFRSRSELWGHQTKVHFMVYTYLCYLCSDTYKSPASVKKHLVNVHGVPIEQQLQIACEKTRRR